MAELIGQEAQRAAEAQLEAWINTLVSHVGVVPISKPNGKPARRETAGKPNARKRRHGRYLGLMRYAPKGIKREARRLYAVDPRKAIAYLVSSKGGK